MAQDEVGEILKALKLDRAFFNERLQKDAVKGSRRHQRPGADHTPASDQRRGDDKKLAAAQDFDIYLGEALLPLLAQSLEALLRYVETQRQRKSRLDPNLKRRFNPLEFLAQHMLRAHPKHLTTPRRAGIYSNFSRWADLERGRRELLRRKEQVREIFHGFKTQGRVKEEALPKVVGGIDEALWLRGKLRDAVAEKMAGRSYGGLVNQGKRDKGTCDFEQFWHFFSSLVMRHDLIEANQLEEGARMKLEEELRVQAQEEAAKHQQEERQRQREEIEKLLKEYGEVHKEMMENLSIRAILDDDWILTGDFPGHGEANFEMEVPPQGYHVYLLEKVMALLGFDCGDKAREHAAVAALVVSATNTRNPRNEGAQEEPSTEEANNTVWDDNRAKHWKVLQELLSKGDLCDGVVEAAVLKKVLLEPAAFVGLRRQVEDELERRRFEEHLTDKGDEAKPERGEEEEEDEEDEDKEARLTGEAYDRYLQGDGEAGVDVLKKPTMESLCRKFGLTMARMEWLHEQFESFLPKNEDGGKPVDDYPDNPSALSKEEMKGLFADIIPEMTLAAFETRFTEIDIDGSGEIEFDEFVEWLREDEIEMTGPTGEVKPTFDQLGKRFSVPVDRIQYLHDMFENFLPEGQKDTYPEEPKSLTKERIRDLLTEVAPDLSEDEFEEQFGLIDLDGSGEIEFDEFLEFLDFEEIAGTDDYED